MSGNLRLNGTTSGYSEITAPAVAGDQTFTLPTSGGTIATTSTDDTGTGGSSGSAKVVGYQQGSWTPATDKGSVTPALAIWARVGNMVTVSADVSSFTSTDATGINIIGLPYNVPSSQAAGSCLYINCKAGYDTVFVTDDSTTKGLLQFYATSNGGSWDQLKYSNIVSGAMACKFVATYRTDDTTWAPVNSATVS